MNLYAGGGEMGRSWYEDEGKYLKKMNTFHDFIDCAHHLVDEQITTRDRLAIVGRSAGGLLVGAVCNLSPQSFKAAVADVPFVDVMNSMSDPTIPLTVTEWVRQHTHTHDDDVHIVSYPVMMMTMLITIMIIMTMHYDAIKVTLMRRSTTATWSRTPLMTT